MSETLQVIAADQHQFAMPLFVVNDAAPLVLIGPAMGTPARIYTPLAEAFAAQGLNAAIVELRGIGGSSLRAGRGVDYGYRDLAERDWAAARAALRARLPQSKLFLFGHSLGGQISVLSAALDPREVSGVVLVAAGSVHFRNWKGARALGIFAFTQFAGILAGTLGYFPGKRVGFGGTEAKTLMQDWARFARTGRLDLAGGEDCEAAMAQLELPVLGLSFDHDHLAPHQSQKNLLSKMQRAKITHLPLSEKDTGAALNHYSWIKNNRVVVTQVASWVGLAQAGA